MPSRRKCATATDVAKASGVSIPDVVSVFAATLRMVRAGKTISIKGFGRLYAGVKPAGRRVMPDLSVIEYPAKKVLKVRTSPKAKRILNRKARKKNGNS